MTVNTLPKPPSNLRPRQVEAFNAIFEHLSRGIGSQLCMLPTGVGKTFLAVAVAQQFKRALFLVPRVELLKQSIASYESVNPGQTAGVIHGGVTNPNAHFTVGMVQTVYNRMTDLPRTYFDLLIFDESHHIMARIWREVAEYFQPRLRLGLSATPERLDGAPLSAIFDVISYSMTVKEAVHEGALVRPKAMQVRTNIGLDSLARSGGDFDAKALEKAINTKARNKIILDTWHKYAHDRKTVIFTAGVNHARQLEKLFKDSGIRAISVSGDDTDREQRVQDFENGKYQVVANSQLLVEGWDDPTVDCVMMCRPTQSRALYIQAVGRGLRLHPGKSDCLILDFHDSSRRHRLVGVWDFWGARVKNKRLDEPEDLMEAEAKTEQDLSELAGTFNIEAYLEEVDVLAPPPDIDEFVLGAHKWHGMPATEKQLETLAKLGYDTGLDWTRGQASAVIGREPATQQQLKLLLALGYDTISHRWSRDEASAAIDDAKRQGKEPDWSVFKRLLRNTPRARVA